MPSTKRSKKATSWTSQSASATRQSYFEPRFRSVKKSSPPKIYGRKQQTLTQINFVPHLDQVDDGVDLACLDREPPETRGKKKKTSHNQSTGPRHPTLTQINFISRRTQPDEEEDLQRLEEEPPQSAQWKGLAEKGIRGNTTPATIPTLARTTTRRIGRPYQGQTAIKPEIQCPKASFEISRLLSMPPPSTPKKLFKTEIPSSQSPEGSVLSTQSQRFVPEPVRSPLIERSTNIPFIHGSGHESPCEKMTSWRPKLEVEDSFETGNGSSTTPTPRSTNLSSNGHASKITKIEIEDSDQEDDVDSMNLENEGSGDVKTATLPEESTETRNTMDSNETVSANNECVLLKQIKTPRITPNVPYSESQQASAQLLGDLSRSTQEIFPPADTDSQWQHTWNSLSANPLKEEHGTMLVRSSQATTVDVTQVSPRLPRSSQPTLHTSFAASQYVSPIQTQGNKVMFRDQRPDSLLSSSPNTSRSGNAAKPLWDGNPMTDSQMLPESIMNFQIPAGSTQDSLTIAT